MFTKKTSNLELWHNWFASIFYQIFDKIADKSFQETGQGCAWPKMCLFRESLTKCLEQSKEIKF